MYKLYKKWNVREKSLENHKTLNGSLILGSEVKSDKRKISYQVFERISNLFKLNAIYKVTC